VSIADNLCGRFSATSIMETGCTVLSNPWSWLPDQC